MIKNALRFWSVLEKSKSGMMRPNKFKVQDFHPQLIILFWLPDFQINYLNLEILLKAKEFLENRTIKDFLTLINKKRNMNIGSKVN